MLIEKIKESVDAKKESYEASAGMLISLFLAGLCALGAGVVWLSSYIGSIEALLCLSAAFLLSSLCFKLISVSKERHVAENIEEAEHEVLNTAHAVSKTVETVAAVPARPSVLIPFLIFTALLLYVIESRRPEKRALTCIRGE